MRSLGHKVLPCRNAWAFEARLISLRQWSESQFSSVIQCSIVSRSLVNSTKSIRTAEDDAVENPMNRIELAGKSAVVTGAARGIGLAIAQRLLASGARCSLWDIDGDA